MGSICGSDASKSLSSDELRTLQASLAHYKSQTSQYQSRLIQTQEELKVLCSDTQTEMGGESDEVEKLKELLNGVMREGWTQLRTLEKALECEERLREDQDKEGLNNIEEVDDILQKRSSYRKDLCRKLSADREAIRTLITSFWFKLESHYRALGKKENLASSLPKHDSEIADSLDRLVTRFSALCQEYIILASNSKSESDETKLNQDLENARVKKTQFEAALSHLEERNRGLAGQSATLKATASELQAELRVMTAANAEMVVKNKETEEHAASLEEDLAIKRSLLIHVKGELAAAERKNRKLKEDLDVVKARQSGNELAAEMNRLEEEKRTLATEISMLEQELASKQGALIVNRKKIAQLEESLRETEDKVQNTGEIDVRMLNMQSTLQELYKSIEENGEDEDMM